MIVSSTWTTSLTRATPTVTRPPRTCCPSRRPPLTTASVASRSSLLLTASTSALVVAKTTTPRTAIADWSSSEDEADAEPAFGEVVEANAFFAEVATTTPTATDGDDTPTKIWGGFRELSNYRNTDDYGLLQACLGGCCTHHRRVPAGRPPHQSQEAPRL